jgi:tRNA(Arg) A34 adenosine deaminase TadA
MLESTGEAVDVIFVKKQIMYIPKDLERLLNKMIARSTCSIQVACLLVDNYYNDITTGWNNCGFSGYGEHAEAMCIRRANRSRLAGSTMYIASRRARNGKMLNSRPCLECQKLIRCVGSIVYLDKSGWRMM